MTAETPGGGGLTDRERDAINVALGYYRPPIGGFSSVKTPLEKAVERILADRGAAVVQARAEVLIVDSETGEHVEAPAEYVVEQSTRAFYEEGVAHGREQARAEVVARVEAVIESWPHGDNGQDYRRAVNQCRDAVRAALAGPNPRGGQDGGE